MEEERPDLVRPGGKTIDSAEADLLDKYTREKAELFPEDAVYTDDNLDEDDRRFSRFQILMKYNEGRYSALYVVRKQVCKGNNTKDDPQCYMLKTGLRIGSSKTNLRIKRELKVLQDMAVVSKRNVVLPAVIDSGKVCAMNYVVMSLLDTNLDRLKEDLGGKFKPASAFHIAMESLNCLLELHARQYVHRDVKPTNFAIGFSPPTRGRIYLIDYGDTVKNGKKIRLGVADGATLPYWSINAHQKDAAKPRMDLESWFYMICELLDPSILTWKSVTDDVEVHLQKTNFWTAQAIRTDFSARQIDPRMILIGELINSKLDFTKADYVKIKSLLQEAQENVLQGARYIPEWIGASNPVNNAPTPRARRTAQK